MKYQYKIIQGYPRKTFYKIESDYSYTFNLGDEIWFPETWKKEFGGGYTWEIKHIQHYVVENFVAIIVAKKN